MGAVDIRIDMLGPLEVRRGETPVAIPGRRCSIVLSTLAMSAGHGVAIERLADVVWDEGLPRSVRGSLHSLVLRLRAVVGATVIRTVPDGYLLDVESDQVDLLRFRRLVGEAAREMDGASARELLGEALRLWRGDPLAGVTSERLQRDVVPSLVEEHLTALERRIHLDMAAGLHGDLVPELRDLVGRHPLREDMWRLLITAQNEAGRRADALDSYHRLRTQLRDRLGVDPSSELQNLYLELLADDSPDTDDERTQATDVEVPTGRDELPGDIADFTGRERELEHLAAAAVFPDGGARTVVISAIDGMAGIGKTTLAIHLAHRLASRFPGGRLFLDLHSFSPETAPMDPATALDHLLRAVQVPGERIPENLAERSALWRAELSGRRMLVVLDNAATAAQVRSLIPGAAGCMVIITSRNRITELDGAQTLSLDALSPADALTLFTAIAGPSRCRAEPAAVAEVLRLCAYLPLAIRIAATRLHHRPTWSVDYLAARLRLADEQHRLDELRVGERSVAAAFSLSYQHLTPEQQRLLRFLVLHPGTSFDAFLAGAIAGLDPGEAEKLLEDLLDAHLLRQPAFGRYQFHDLLRSYARTAAHQVETAEERDEAIHRVLDFYAQVMQRARDRFAMYGHTAAVYSRASSAHLPDMRDQGEASAWADKERANLVAVTDYAAEHGCDEELCRLSEATWWFFRLRGHRLDRIATQRKAVDAAGRLGDPAVRADMLRILGNLYWESNQYPDAIRQYHEALALYQETEDLRGQLVTMTNLGMLHALLGRYEQTHQYQLSALALGSDTDGSRFWEASALMNIGFASWHLGKYAEAIEYSHQAFARYLEADDQCGQGGVLSNLGLIYGSLGDSGKALDFHERAVHLIRASGDLVGESEILNDYAETLRALGEPDRARALNQQALELAKETNTRLQQAHAHNGIAETQRDTDLAAAHDHWERALAIYTDLGLPEAEHVRDRMRAAVR